MKIFRSNFSFAILYILLMAPTYILPYFGSNSTITNLFTGAMGLGFTPQWWMHVWSLATLALAAWMRGKWVDKGYLPVFSVAAGIFDMSPVLSSIPLIPTIFHLLVIVLGVTGKEKNDNELDLSKVNKVALTSFLIVTGVAVLGITLFLLTASRTVTSRTKENIQVLSETNSLNNIPKHENIVNNEEPQRSTAKKNHTIKEASKKAVNENSVPFEEGQNWTGSYTCAQGNIPLILNITKVSKSPDEKSYEIDAIFEFGTGTQTTGSYNMKGNYYVDSAKIKFKPLDWISRPSGYITVGMSGIVSNNTYSGKIDNSTCKSFSVSK